MDYYTGAEDSSSWEREEESNYLYYDQGPTTLVEDPNVQQPQEHTSTEPPDYDYSSYDEYLYVPNYLEEVKDDFR